MKKYAAIVLTSMIFGVFAHWTYQEVSFIANNQKAWSVFRSNPEVVASLEIAEPKFSVKK